MAIRDANKAVLTVAADENSTPDTVTQLTSTTIDESAEVHSARHMTSSRPDYFMSYTSWSMSGEGLWNRGDSGQSTFLQGNSVYVTYMPEGNTTGKPLMRGSGIVTAVGLGAQMDNALQVSFALQGEGQLVRSTVGAPTQDQMDQEPPAEEEQQQDQQQEEAKQPDMPPPEEEQQQEQQQEEVQEPDMPPPEEEVQEPDMPQQQDPPPQDPPPQEPPAEIDEEAEEEIEEVVDMPPEANGPYSVYLLDSGHGIVDDDGNPVPNHWYAYDTDRDLFIAVRWDNGWQAIPGVAFINVKNEGAEILSYPPDSSQYVPGA